MSSILFKTLLAQNNAENKVPLTITCLTSSGKAYVSFVMAYSPKIPRIQYSVNGGQWQAWTKFAANNRVYLNYGQYVQFRNLDDFLSQDSSNYFSFHLRDGLFDLSGNIMSMLNWSETLKPSCFNHLFSTTYGSSKANIRSIANLELPATKLEYRCYAYMFGNTRVQSLDGFKLPATELEDSCYQNMFRDGSVFGNLELPATKLAPYCYSGMFKGCDGLYKAPELPATTLAEGCYSSMFQGCSNLTEAHELPATTLADWCYSYMFNGCTSLTTAPSILPATTLAGNCYYYMFQNCSSLTTAPELPATTLAGSCYRYMFQNCSSLTTAPELPATTLASYCYAYMFSGCSSLTKAPELPATTLESRCYQSMFQDCTSLTTAPELPATTLGECCYQNMFNGCSNLNYIKVGFTSWGDYEGQFTQDWLAGVSSKGTFVKPEELEQKIGPSYIPESWLGGGEDEGDGLYTTQNNLTSNDSNPDYIVSQSSTMDGDAYYAMDEDSDGTYSQTNFSSAEASWWKIQFKAPVIMKKIKIKCSNEFGYDMRLQGSNDQNNWYTFEQYIQGETYSEYVQIEFETERFYKFYRLQSVTTNYYIQIYDVIFTYDFPPVTFALEEGYSYGYMSFSPQYWSDSWPEETIQYRIVNNYDDDPINTQWEYYPFDNTMYLYQNQYIQFRNTSDTLSLNESNYFKFNLSYAYFKCFGNIQSMLNYRTDIPEYSFYWLFSYLSKLRDVQGLVLPAKTLSKQCYDGMFYECGNLQLGPNIMAETLEQWSLEYMFYNCYSLEYLKVAFTDWQYYEKYATEQWICNVPQTSTGTFVKPEALEQIRDDYSYIPYDWTVINY